MRRYTFQVVIALLIAVSPAVAHADPLPDGAAVRLGSTRFLHGDWIHSLTFFPDGKSILAGNQREAAIIWDVATGNMLRRFPAVTAGLAAVLSPDGTTVAAVENGPIIHLWDVATGKELRQLVGANGRSFVLAFSGDGKTIASGDGKSLLVWDVGTGAISHRLGAGEEFQKAIALSPDGSVLVSGSMNKTMRLWDAATGKELRRLEGETGFMACFAFAPNGKSLAGSCETKTGPGSHRSSLRVWDVATGKSKLDRPGSYNCVAFSPDGKLMVTGGLEVALVLDAATGEEIRKLPRFYQHVTRMAFSPDGKILATSGYDRRIRLWDVATWTEIRPNEGHIGPIQALAFGRDGRTVISAGLDQSIRFWDWPTGRELRRTDGLGSHWGVQTLATSPDGKSLLSFGLEDKNGPYRVWDISTGNELSRFGAKSSGRGAMAFTSDGKCAIIGQWDGAIGLWDLATGKRLREVGKHKGHIVAVAPTPDGTAAVWAGEYQGAGLRDLATGEERRQFRGSQHHSECGMILTPDGLLLILAGGNGPLNVWDVKTGQPVAGWQGVVAGPRGIACSADGRLLATASHNGVELWDVLTRRQFRKLNGHRGEVRAVAFSPDGTVLASAGADGTVVIWDLTGRLKDGRLPELALTPDELTACWRDLGGDDPDKAHRAVWSLAASAQTSIPFLQKRIQPITLVDTERVVDLIAKLNHDTFAEREKATRELSAMGEAADEALRRAMENKPAPEAARRLELLVKALDGPIPTGERVRRLRAVAVLEHVADAPSRSMLEALAGGLPDARLTRAANASLGRVRAKIGR